MRTPADSDRPALPHRRAHARAPGDIFHDPLSGGTVRVAADGALEPWEPAPFVFEPDSALIAAADGDQAALRDRTARARAAFAARPVAPPGALRTDSYGILHEQPREPADIWDPVPDQTAAAVRARVDALLAIPDDTPPDRLPALIDLALPAAVRSPRQDGWVAERRQAFLERLAGTASVTEAARFVAMSRQSARRLYNRDPDFRRAWHAALRRAKVVLLETAFERATRGTQVPKWDRDGQLIGYRERHHDGLLISLIQMCSPGGRAGLIIDDDEDDDGDAGDDGEAIGASGATAAADDATLPMVWPLPHK